MNIPQSLLSAILVASLSTFISGCNSNQKDSTQEEQTEGTTSNLQTVNTLSGQEKEEGWILLFDGQNLDQWRGFKKETVPNGWTVDGDALHFTGEKSGDIITKDEFEDFELALEWKISEGGNSGIFFNVVEDDKYEQVYQTGPEMQVLDDAKHPDAKENPNKRVAGANYDLYEPSSRAKGAGEWNSIKLIVKNKNVQHWMNGEKVVEYEIGSDKWKEDVKNSKFIEMPNYGLAEKGHIALQDHDDKVWFRNIKIRRL